MRKQEPPFDQVPLPGSAPIATETVDTLRLALHDLFVIEDVTLDLPYPGGARFRGRFMCDLATCFDELRRRFEALGFTPLVRHDDDAIAVIAAPVVFDSQPSNWVINLILFIVTVFSTLLVGAPQHPAYTGQEFWNDLWLGIPYSVSVMLILGAHELGHYFAARYHKVPVTLPYFIPFPSQASLTGTFGAFIRLKAPVKNRRALLDVGAAGPLAGFVLAVPIVILGLAASEVQPLPPGGGYILEGNSLLYALAKILVFGRFLPAGGQDVFLSQVAWAGWVGLLVTGLNLIPVGQLDGGHMAYVLFGDKARRLFWPVIIVLLGLAAYTLTPMWLLWVGLIFFLIGNRHAIPLDDVTPLDGTRKLIAILTLILFFLVFTPVPIRFVPPVG